MRYSLIENPLFDADNHLYETEEAFLKYLPKEYAGAIQYVQIKGRTKIAIRGHAVVHSLSQWMDEVWSFNYKSRIFTTPAPRDDRLPRRTAQDRHRQGAAPSAGGRTRKLSW